MKVAIITDQHFGTRNDSLVHLNNQREFYEKIFFPYIDKHEIDTILDLGDTFDRRKFINYVTLSQSKDMWFNQLKNRNITIHSITGNHTCYYKNTNEINYELVLREYNNLHIYEQEPVELQLGSTKVLMVPWIAKDNYDVCIEALSNTDAQVCMGHFEIKGFEMMRGQLCDHGFDKKEFNKFDVVYSGHFHHPSEYDNIKYLGAPYEMNWSDYDGKRGFHIFDTETRDLEFIPNPHKMFHKIFYDDTDATVEDIAELETEQLTNAYVKVIIKSKNNPYIFDLFLDRIQSSTPAGVKVVEDHMNLDIVDEDELIDEAQDTHTILNTYIDNLETGVDKSKLKKAISDLYSEAMSI